MLGLELSMSETTVSDLAKYWLRIFLPLLFGMLAGHLLFNVRIWINTDEQLNCSETNASKNRFRPTAVRKPRIFCYINTFPENYNTKAIHVQNTWARRCDGFYFTSTVSHPNLSVLVLNLTVPEVRSHLWVKMRKILREVYHVADDYDYFYKADDDTYAFVPNLRQFLAAQDEPSEPVMWGYRWMRLCPGGYFSGGAGYVLTREALKRIVERAIDRHPDCPTTDEDKEDVKMCLCGQAVGVRLEDGRLKNGIDLFYPYSILSSAKTMAQKNMKSLYFGFGGLGPERSVLDFDPSHISFHYTESHEMYIFEFL
ncbi:glycoprotein-N-acetylgalactosamine 3-beta-galactosyltransferase, partial [Clonorchis sinensis]